MILKYIIDIAMIFYIGFFGIKFKGNNKAELFFKWIAIILCVFKIIFLAQKI
jgi:hypothetical protein